MPQGKKSRLILALTTRPYKEPQSWEPGPGSPKTTYSLICSRRNSIQVPWPLYPALCPLPSTTPASVPTMQAAGARRGGGTRMTQNHTRPHLLSPVGLATALLPSEAGASVWVQRWEWGGEQLAVRLPQTEGWEAAPGMSFPTCPRTRGKTGPPSRPSHQGRRSVAAGAGAKAGGRSPRPSPAPPPGPARRSRQAPAPARRRPRRAARLRPGPLTRGAAVRTHLRSRPLPGHPQRRRGHSPQGQRGGRGRRARAAVAPAARPGSGKAPARLRVPGQPSALGAGPEPAVPACPLALGRPPPRAAPRRPAAARRSLSPPPARLRAAPAGSGAGPAHRGRGSLRPRPAAGPRRPRLPEKGSRERGREREGVLKGAAAAARPEGAVSPAAPAIPLALSWQDKSPSQYHPLHSRTGEWPTERGSRDSDPWDQGRK